MSKYRVYELAKDFDTTSKVIIDILARNNVTAKNHMSSIDDDAKAIIDRTFARKTGATADSKPVQQAHSENAVPATKVNMEHSAQAKEHPVIKPTSQGQQQAGTEGTNNQGQQAGQPRFNNQGQQGGQQRFNNQGQQGGQQRFNNQGQQGGQQRFNNQGQQGGQQRFNNQGQQGGQPRFNNQGQQGGQQRFNNQGQQGGQPRFNNQGQQGGGQQRFNNQGQQGGQQRFNNQGQQGGQPRFNNQGQQGGQQRFNNQGQQGGQSRFNNQGQQGGQQRFNNQGQQGGQQRNTNTQHPGERGTRRDGNSGRPNFDRSSDRGSNRRGGSNRRSSSASQVAAPKQEPVRPKTVKLGEIITVKDLAHKMCREVSELIKKLMTLGIMVTINQEIDLDTATIVASEFGVTVEELPPEIEATLISEIEDDEASLLPRSPVVTIMGHVDHGKTSLLDAIRKTHITASEAGGITQHIGAYQVNCQGKKIVFLDTPGHEAFTAMRARGAQVTDIAILVVAADDGVMPQTIEAINHAKSANVPIIVAVNKIDRPGANPDRVKQQLAEYALIPEEWGGDTVMVSVSAHTKEGISELLEMILLVADMRELKANPDRAAQGTIIEAQLDKGRGPVATVLVQKGTLHIGDSIIAGIAFGKVRAMVNERGEKVKKALPSTPVEVLGLSDVPQAGDILNVVDERTARMVAERRQSKKRSDELGQNQKVTLDDLFKQIQDGNIKDLNVVIKSDVQGSTEALRQSLENLKNDEVRVCIIHSGVGAINESDVMLASAANALIIGFNVRPDNNARKAADNEKIDIRTYSVIYDAINDVQAAITGMLAPEYKEVILGRVEVRQVISIPKGVIAGSYVTEGKITNSAQVRVVRNGVVVYEGKIESLRRFKDDVKEVATGYECGISIEKYRDVKENDIIEAFTMELVKPAS
ncbi:MAG: lepA 1 [Firmicutes bacterium]|nr:lepA 1 [Bacillota bacterium]